MNPTYEGTSGSTQGERKLSSPATKATANPSAAGSFTSRRTTSSRWRHSRQTP